MQPTRKQFQLVVLAISALYFLLGAAVIIGLYLFLVSLGAPKWIVAIGSIYFGWKWLMQVIASGVKVYSKGLIKYGLWLR